MHERIRERPFLMSSLRDSSGVIGLVFGETARTNDIVHANGVYVDTGTRHFSRRTTRRKKERRKSGHNSGNQRPELFRR